MSENNLQIVAFSTNETTQTPNNIISIYLEQNNHSILKKSRSFIEFSTTLKNPPKLVKVMIYSILDLTNEYTGITNVNCYIFFIDLEKEDSNEKLDFIINYAKDFCDLTKKVFVIGMLNGNEERKHYITKDEIIKSLNTEQFDFDYKEIKMNQLNEISDFIHEILIYSSKNAINNGYFIPSEKDGGESNSCKIF